MAMTQSGIVSGLDPMGQNGRKTPKKRLSKLELEQLGAYTKEWLLEYTTHPEIKIPSDDQKIADFCFPKLNGALAQKGMNILALEVATSTAAVTKYLYGAAKGIADAAKGAKEREMQTFSLRSKPDERGCYCGLMLVYDPVDGDFRGVLQGKWDSGKAQSKCCDTPFVRGLSGAPTYTEGFDWFGLIKPDDVMSNVDIQYPVEIPKDAE